MALDLTVRVGSDLSGVNPADWNRLDHGASPFLEFGFLLALEQSGSIGGRSGWVPCYITVHGASEGAQPRLVGAVAAFVKTHSYGEYIFDWGWANASQRAGIPYYPKLVIAAPATPATGRRILLHRDLDERCRRQVTLALVETVRELAEQAKCSSIHWLFCTEDEQQRLAELGFASRASFQFHWRNPGYASFDEFLSRLVSRKRKNVRKERLRAQQAIDGLSFVGGRDLTPAHVVAMDRYYRRTTSRYGGRAYLRPGFFEALVEHLPERIRFADVRQGGAQVAGALFFETDGGLYGRYWGCEQDVEFLHFETAYYAGMDRCIERGIPVFEAGAQGEHKLLRGFVPASTYSAHWIRHPGLFEGIREFLREEAQAMPRHMRGLAQYLPFKHAADGEGAKGASD